MATYHKKLTITSATTTTPVDTPVVGSVTMPECGHDVCCNLARLGKSYKKGVSVVCYRQLRTQQTGSSVYNTKTEIILGRVGLGRKFGMLSTCSGHFEPAKDKCCVDTAIRELYEEFKITNTRGKFRYVSLVGGAIVFCLDCTGMDIAKMQTQVIADHATARRIIGLPTDDACKHLTYDPNEPAEVTHAATYGEMQTLITVPYIGTKWNSAGTLSWCSEHVTRTLELLLGFPPARGTMVVWRK